MSRSKKKLILSLGEGNFSFSCVLQSKIKKLFRLNSGNFFFSTEKRTLERLESDVRSSTQSDRIHTTSLEYLGQLGSEHNVHVLTDLDALERTRNLPRIEEKMGNKAEKIEGIPLIIWMCPAGNYDTKEIMKKCMNNPNSFFKMQHSGDFFILGITLPYEAVNLFTEGFIHEYSLLEIRMEYDLVDYGLMNDEIVGSTFISGIEKRYGKDEKHFKYFHSNNNGTVVSGNCKYLILAFKKRRNRRDEYQFVGTEKQNEEEERKCLFSVLKNIRVKESNSDWKYDNKKCGMEVLLDTIKFICGECSEWGEKSAGKNSSVCLDWNRRRKVLDKKERFFMRKLFFETEGSKLILRRERVDDDQIRIQVLWKVRDYLLARNFSLCLESSLDSWKKWRMFCRLEFLEENGETDCGEKKTVVIHEWERGISRLQRWVDEVNAFLIMEDINKEFEFSLERLIKKNGKMGKGFVWLVIGDEFFSVKCRVLFVHNEKQCEFVV